jgi:uncharacterized OsmC-like protein
MALKREGEKLVGECKSSWQGGVRSQTSFDGAFPILMDEPEDSLGNGEGPTPMEVMLASISGCAVATFAYVADTMGIELEDLSAVAKGEAIHLEAAGWRISDVETRIEVKAAPDTPFGEVEACFSRYQAFCAIKNSIEEGVRIRVGLNLNRDKR